MTRKPPPRCKAILLCERMVRDSSTDRQSLIGIFDQLTLASFPGYTPSFRVYLQLLEGIGDYQLTVEIHDLRENRVLHQSRSRRIQFHQRLAKMELMLSIPPLLFPHAGNYDLVAFADHQEIDRQKLLITAEDDHGSEETPPSAE